MAIEKFEEIRGFMVQGYMDDTHGWIRLSDKQGNLRLYYYESKDQKVLEGNMNKSKLAKEIAQEMINRLIAEKKAA